MSYYVPEAFSPNGDGINDGFFPVTLGFEYYEFLIYDRWGELIFKGNKEQPTWDGYLDGIPVKYDVYTWKLVGESPYVDKVIRSTGRVTVLR